jgi:hypothetical protein
VNLVIRLCFYDPKVVSEKVLKVLTTHPDFFGFFFSISQTIQLMDLQLECMKNSSNFLEQFFHYLKSQTKHPENFFLHFISNISMNCTVLSSKIVWREREKKASTNLDAPMNIFSLL